MEQERQWQQFDRMTQPGTGSVHVVNAQPNRRPDTPRKHAVPPFMHNGLRQIMLLLHLAPAIQECILFLSPGEAKTLTELAMRRIAREPRWDRQCERFEQLLKK
jgi:hypothetical protein